MVSSKRKKRLPSQVKYDQTHPTVSCRLPERFHARLMALLGNESFASWVIDHLDNDEAMVNARVEELAGERDNLRNTIFNLRRKCEELDRQVEQRHCEVTRPIEEERLRLQKQLDMWYQREKARNESRVERLRSEESEAKDGARKAKMDLLFLENRKKAIETERQQLSEERETWKKEARRATEFINRCPWLFCHQCPGAAFNQILGQMMTTLSSFATEGRGHPDDLQLDERQKDV